MVETNGKQVAKPPGRVATTALASTIVCSLTLLYVMAPRLAHPQGMNALSIVGKGSSAIFDWEWYRHFVGLCDKTVRGSEKYFWVHGQFSGHPARPFKLVIKYHATGGLCNQLYGHVHALVIGKLLAKEWRLDQVEALIAPANKRSSYSDAANETHYFFTPVSSLLDYEKMATHWSRRGLLLRPTPKIHKYKMLRQTFEYMGQMRYEGHWSERCVSVDMPGMERPTKWDTYSKVAKKVLMDTIKPIILGDPYNQVPCIELDIHGTMFQIATSETESLMALSRFSARGLHFNSDLEVLADDIEQAMDPHGSGSVFNGLHLRIEEDAAGWFDLYGGREEFLEAFLSGMEKLGFSASQPLYVASGLLTYNNTDAVREIEELISKRGLGRMTYKERLISPERLQGLHSEQLALLDFLVLLRSSKFVGFGGSSFTYLLRELRALKKRPKKTSYMVYPPDQDNMFDSCGKFTEG